MLQKVLRCDGQDGFLGGAPQREVDSASSSKSTPNRSEHDMARHDDSQSAEAAGLFLPELGR